MLLFFSGGNSFLLRHAHLADVGGLPGRCSYHCFSHAQDVKTALGAGRRKMGRPTTEGTGAETR